jgi:hypothetical protein
MKFDRVFALLSLFFVTSSSQSIRFYDFKIANGFNLSQACLNVLNHNITCDSSLEVVVTHQTSSAMYLC